PDFFGMLGKMAYQNRGSGARNMLHIMMFGKPYACISQFIRNICTINCSFDRMCNVIVFTDRGEVQNGMLYCFHANKGTRSLLSHRHSDVLKYPQNVNFLRVVIGEVKR